MNVRIEIAPKLELIVIDGGSLKFNREDKPLRDLVRRAYKEVQVPVLEQHGESIEDKALRPVDSIGWTVERGMLTDRDDPQQSYNHIILAEVDENGDFKPRGMRVTDEIRVPRFGKILMEYFSGMVPKEYASKRHAVDLRLLSDGASGTAELTAHEILMSFARHLTIPPDRFLATFSDGVGIEKAVLAAKGYEHYGPEEKTMLWAPSLKAETREQYGIAIPTELYVLFNGQVSDHRITLNAGLFIAVNKYIKEGSAELNARRLKRAGYNFDTLPAVVKTREAHSEVAAANGGFIPTSPIRL